MGIERQLVTSDADISHPKRDLEVSLQGEERNSGLSCSFFVSLMRKYYFSTPKYSC